MVGSGKRDTIRFKGISDKKGSSSFPLLPADLLGDFQSPTKQTTDSATRQAAPFATQDDDRLKLSANMLSMVDVQYGPVLYIDRS